MGSVSWTPQALDDLASICLFIGRDSPQIAGVFADRALHAVDRLADHPRSGRVVPELGIETVREIIMGNYRLIYRIREQRVEVLTVHHGARLLRADRIESDP